MPEIQQTTPHCRTGMHMEVLGGDTSIQAKHEGSNLNDLLLKKNSCASDVLFDCTVQECEMTPQAANRLRLK